MRHNENDNGLLKMQKPRVDKGSQLQLALKIAMDQLLKDGRDDTIKKIAEETGVRPLSGEQSIGNGVEFCGLAESGPQAGMFMYKKKEGKVVKHWAIEPRDRPLFETLFAHAETLSKDPQVAIKRMGLTLKANAQNADGTIKAEAAHLPLTKH